MADELDVLLARVDDPALRADLQRQVDHLRSRRTFGLVFEQHLPETVRLPSLPVRRGSLVSLRDDSDDRPWVVQAVAGEQATIDRGDDEPTEVAVGDLLVVAEFGDPIYPGLDLVGSVEKGGDKPTHVVINGENHHVLEALRFTHAAKVDCIYIDPPYNLGGDLTYNDKRVARDDAFRHSKWLSFMDRRLRLAQDLLTDTGVMVVAVDDNEQAHLRLLMDQVFSEANFIATVVWQGGRKNDARFVSTGHDYMLIYARSQQALKDAGVEWDVPRPAQAEMLDAGRRAWEESEHDPEAATTLVKAWIRSLPPGHGARVNNRFYEFDSGTGRVFRKDNISWPGGGGPRYDVLHPATGQSVRVPSSGWRFQEAKMQEMIEAGRILFGKDHTEFINRKLYLDEAESMARVQSSSRNAPVLPAPFGTSWPGSGSSSPRTPVSWPVGSTWSRARSRMRWCSTSSGGRGPLARR